MSSPALKQNLAITTTPSHELHLRAVPTPTPGPNECLIHVRATGICGSDVHFWKEGGIGSSKVEGELGLGHESAGVVVGLGEGVENWSIGECFSFSFVPTLVMVGDERHMRPGTRLLEKRRRERYVHSHHGSLNCFFPWVNSCLCFSSLLPFLSFPSKTLERLPHAHPMQWLLYPTYRTKTAECSLTENAPKATA